MNVNGNRTRRPIPMQEAPGTRPHAAEASCPRSPSEVLAILRPTHDEPRPILIGGLWKTGLLPQGASS